jgi:hypothetical protein
MPAWWLGRSSGFVEGFGSMRYAICIFLLALSPIVAAAKDPLASRPESVDFCGRQFFFAGARRDYAEYIPQGQTLKNWTQLVAIRTGDGFDDPRVYAQEVITLIKKSDPLSRSAMRYSAKKESAILDYITSPADRSYIEFNILKIEKNGENSIVAYQYVVREYKDQKRFLESLKDLRLQTINEMIDRGLTINEPAKPNARMSWLPRWLSH